MYPFSCTRVSDVRAAVRAGRDGGRYIAGGTTLVDLMRETVERPPLAGLESAQAEWVSEDDQCPLVFDSS